MDNDEIHDQCVMKERWATLEEYIKNSEESRTKEIKRNYDKLQEYMVSQAEINTTNTAMVSKLRNKIYGNAQNGMDTTIKLNELKASSEIVRVEESLKRLWWAFGIIAFTLFGNLIKLVFF